MKTLSALVEEKRESWNRNAEINFARRGKRGDKMFTERWANGTIMAGHETWPHAGSMIPLDRAKEIEAAGWKVSL